MIRNGNPSLATHVLLTKLLDIDKDKSIPFKDNLTMKVPPGKESFELTCSGDEILIDF